VASFGDAAHAYSFWEGVPPQGKQAFGYLFASSTNMQAWLHNQVAVVQPLICCTRCCNIPILGAALQGVAVVLIAALLKCLQPGSTAAFVLRQGCGAWPEQAFAA
jgi:hypothetical protein